MSGRRTVETPGSSQNHVFGGLFNTAALMESSSMTTINIQAGMFTGDEGEEERETEAWISRQ